MTHNALQKRFEYLGQVLNLSRGLGYFNSGQRTCLHQERAALMQAQEIMSLNGTSEASPRYTIPPHLETKCRRVLKDFK